MNTSIETTSTYHMDPLITSLRSNVETLTFHLAHGQTYEQESLARISQKSLNLNHLRDKKHKVLGTITEKKLRRQPTTASVNLSQQDLLLNQKRD
jgi:hypothetical protein